MMKSLRNVILAMAALAFTFAAVVPTQVASAGDDNRLRLRAEIAGKTLASGKADYRERQRGKILVQRFSVEVEDAEPGAQLPVLVNGVQFGLIFVNDLGGGEIQFRTASEIDDPGDGSPIDPDFPRLQPGDEISVGKALSGTFQID